MATLGFRERGDFGRFPTRCQTRKCEGAHFPVTILGTGTEFLPEQAAQMIAVKEDGPARGLLMGKKFPGNGALSGVAQAGKR